MAETGWNRLLIHADLTRYPGSLGPEVRFNRIAMLHPGLS
jgi:hypothetical protein